MTIKIRLVLALLTSCLLLNSPAYAIVNIENMNAQPTRVGWSGLLDTAMELRYGNSEREDVKLGARGDWFGGEDTAFIVGAYNYGKSGGTKDADGLFIHGRYIDAYTRDIAFEYFTQHEENEFRRLSRRDMAGAGVRFTLDEAALKRQNTFSIGVFHSDETISAVLPEESAQGESAWYGNLYWVFKWEINANSQLANTFYYQPVLANGDGFRALNLFALQVRIDGRLSLKVSIDAEHDHNAPSGIKPTDVRILTGLTYEF